MQATDLGRLGSEAWWYLGITSAREQSEPILLRASWSASNSALFAAVAAGSLMKQKSKGPLWSVVGGR